jgi:2-C-methyl-D-erythritol 4-phosphate cytidylyltransferase
MGADKLWADLEGRPLLAWSIEAFASTAAVDLLVIVTGPASKDRVAQLVAPRDARPRVVVGGERRRDSVAAGLRVVLDCEWVVVHDGARPFVTPDLITRGLEAARVSGAAIAAVPVNDTIKSVRDDIIVDTVERSTLWAAQTPQVFRTELLWQAHQRTADDATDDAAMVEALGTAVRVYPGAYGNMKVTFPEDLDIARALARLRSTDTGHAGRDHGPS